MGKLLALLDLFRKGNQVADPQAWKAGQVNAAYLGALVLALVAVAKAFGFDLPMDRDTALLIGGGVFAFVNWVLTIVTSRKAGILPAKPDAVLAQPDGNSAAQDNLRGGGP